MEHFPKQTGSANQPTQRIYDNAASLAHLPSREQMERDLDSAIANILSQQGQDAQNVVPPPPAPVASPVAAPVNTPSPSAPAAQPAAEVRSAGITVGERILLCVAAAAMLLCGYLISSQNMIFSKESTGGQNCSMEFDSEMSVMVSGAVSDIADLPRVYVLPYADEPAPKPDKEAFTTTKYTPIGFDKPITVQHYEDETITVNCWREQYLGATINMSEVYIAHPTQFRRAFAGGSYESKVRYTPVAIAKNVNAVIAMSADYCQYRKEGVVIHHRKLLRNNASRKLDVLLYDVDGNLHTVKDVELESSGILEKYDILYAFTFGPALVEEGKACDRKHLQNYSMGEVTSVEPRAAIGQIGERHYILCTVDGRTQRINFTQEEMDKILAEITDPVLYEQKLEEFEHPGFQPSGLTIVQLANFMESKGCSTAYAMDGGQTATMIFNDKQYNTPAYGGQRTVSDILYFSTALPEE
ncbi:MAG: phosphodiester glycosidase family protein [Ruminococcaceae bacterium]|nr:phosphodiester glycosidase family protein [Oscillospiraceae bacterium]